MTLLEKSGAHGPRRTGEQALSGPGRGRSPSAIRANSQGYTLKVKRNPLYWAVAASVLLAGCQGQSDDELLAAAQRDLNAGKPAAAVIHLKTALQNKPESGEARFQLGRALLETGDAGSAAVELSKALELKQSPDRVLPLLGRAMLNDGQAARFVAQHGSAVLASDAANAELQAIVAGAYASLGQGPRAKEALAEAARLAPELPAVRLMRARLLVREGDAAAALALVAGVLERDPAHVEAWQLRGDIGLVAGQPPAQAIEAYRQALKLKPNDLAARAGLVAVLIRTRALDEAGKELEPLVNVARNSQRTQLLQAQLAVERRDFKTARELAQLLVRAAPDSARVRELAGAVDAEQGALQQAEVHLQRALRLDPQSVPARGLLAHALLRSGQPQRALDVLQPLLALAQPGAEALALAAEAQLQLGDAKTAEGTLRRAGDLLPGDVRLRTALALSRQAQGQPEEAVRELRAIAAGDAGTVADLALVRVLMQNRRWDEALAAADALQVKSPQSPVPLQLRGQVELQRQAPDPARKAFERALALDKAYFPAVAGLVQLDAGQGRPDAAGERLRAFLADSPGHVPALLMLAELLAQRGEDVQAVRKLLREAIASRPDDPQPHVLLVNQHLASRDPKGALTAAEQAVAVLPEDPLVLDALGRTRLAGGDGEQALQVFRKLTGSQPSAPGPWLRSAEAQMLLKDRTAAIASLRRALALQPNLLEAQRGLVLLALDAGAPQDALAVVRQVQQQRPREAVGLVMEGDVAAAQRRWGDAAAAYRRALELAGRSGDLAIKLHTALVAADPAGAKSAGARQFAEQWVAQHPKDAQFHLHLGDTAVAAGELAAGEQHYRSAVELSPDSPQALNNLAWAMARQKKAGALAHAEKANALAPGRPEMLDTLALALAASGQLPRALEVQKQALALAPGNALVKFNLAKLYIEAGDKVEARRQLEQVALFGNRFKDQAAVRNLLAGL